MNEIVPIEIIENKILLIRGQKVMLDRDLAVLYGVKTFVLNQAVKRNIKRFPEDFMFQLTKEELENLTSQIVISRSPASKTGWGGSRTMPYAFTEQGIAMLSSVLNSERAIAVNILIMRTFVKIRQFIANYKELAQKLDLLEDTVLKHIKKYNTEIKAVFDVIRKVMSPPKKRTYKIGFLR